MENDKLTAKRFEELYDRALTRGTTEYTEFLNLDEISTLKALNLPCSLYGGYDNAERCVAAFGEEAEFPIKCIKIEPKGEKFAENLTHRDFLGTLLGTGINRGLIGDIIVDGKSAYAFCLDSISEYLIQSVDRVKHTSVKCAEIEMLPEILIKEPEAKEIIVSSLRLDAVAAAIFKLSRNQISKLILTEKVFINARVETKDGKVLNDGDIVTVRGKGKFIFKGTERKTKKDRLLITVAKY